jgi:hypothetical protein
LFHLLAQPLQAGRSLVLAVTTTEFLIRLEPLRLLEAQYCKQKSLLWRGGAEAVALTALAAALVDFLAIQT